MLISFIVFPHKSASHFCRETTVENNQFPRRKTMRGLIEITSTVLSNLRNDLF